MEKTISKDYITDVLQTRDKAWKNQLLTYFNKFKKEEYAHCWTLYLLSSYLQKKKEFSLKDVNTFNVTNLFLKEIKTFIRNKWNIFSFKKSMEEFAVYLTDLRGTNVDGILFKILNSYFTSKNEPSIEQHEETPVIETPKEREQSNVEQPTVPVDPTPIQEIVDNIKNLKPYFLEYKNQETLGDDSVSVLSLVARIFFEENDLKNCRVLIESVPENENLFYKDIKIYTSFGTSKEFNFLDFENNIKDLKAKLSDKPEGFITFDLLSLGMVKELKENDQSEENYKNDSLNTKLLNNLLHQNIDGIIAFTSKITGKPVGAKAKKRLNELTLTLSNEVKEHPLKEQNIDIIKENLNKDIEEINKFKADEKFKEKLSELETLETYFKACLEILDKISNPELVNDKIVNNKKFEKLRNDLGVLLGKVPNGKSSINVEYASLDNDVKKMLLNLFDVMKKNFHNDFKLGFFDFQKWSIGLFVKNILKFNVLRAKLFDEIKAVYAKEVFHAIQFLLNNDINSWTNAKDSTIIPVESFGSFFDYLYRKNNSLTFDASNIHSSWFTNDWHTNPNAGALYFATVFNSPTFNELTFFRFLFGKAIRKNGLEFVFKEFNKLEKISKEK